MAAKHIRDFVQLDADAHAALETALDRLGLSARAYERVLKVALTLADLDGVDRITRAHIAEAISYRNLDRSSWGE
jgi:Mg chelatase-like protein